MERAVFACFLLAVTLGNGAAFYEQQPLDAVLFVDGAPTYLRLTNSTSLENIYTCVLETSNSINRVIRTSNMRGVEMNVGQLEENANDVIRRLAANSPRNARLLWKSPEELKMFKGRLARFLTMNYYNRPRAEHEAYLNYKAERSADRRHGLRNLHPTPNHQFPVLRGEEPSKLPQLKPDQPLASVSVHNASNNLTAHASHNSIPSIPSPVPASVHVPPPNATPSTSPPSPTVTAEPLNRSTSPLPSIAPATQRPLADPSIYVLPTMTTVASVPLTLGPSSPSSPSPAPSTSSPVAATQNTSPSVAQHISNLTSPTSPLASGFGVANTSHVPLDSARSTHGFTEASANASLTSTISLQTVTPAKVSLAEVTVSSTEHSGEPLEKSYSTDEYAKIREEDKLTTEVSVRENGTSVEELEVSAKVAGIGVDDEEGREEAAADADNAAETSTEVDRSENSSEVPGEIDAFNSVSTREDGDENSKFDSTTIRSTEEGDADHEDGDRTRKRKKGKRKHQKKKGSKGRKKRRRTDSEDVEDLVNYDE